MSFQIHNSSIQEIVEKVFKFCFKTIIKIEMSLNPLNDNMACIVPKHDVFVELFFAALNNYFQQANCNASKKSFYENTRSIIFNTNYAYPCC